MKIKPEKNQACVGVKPVTTRDDCLRQFYANVYAKFFVAKKF